MSGQKNTDAIDVVIIKIMDRDFKIKCPINKIAALQEASLYLNNKICEVTSGDKFATIDRALVIAALNTIYELIDIKQQYNIKINSLKEQLIDVNDKLSKFLHEVSLKKTWKQSIIFEKK